MSSTISTSYQAIQTQRFQRPPQAPVNAGPTGDSYVPSSASQDPGVYSPKMLQANAFGGASTSRAAQRNAEANYRRHANDEPLELNNRQDVGRLISRSPQNDNLQVTNNDGDRCGGAAMLNAMLLDGNHRDNARAIRGLAENHQMSQEQRTAFDQAVTNMESGRLRPSEAAVLQETLFDVADARDGVTNGGLNLEDMRSTVSNLRERGAFGNTQEVSFMRNETGRDRRGNQESHWTTSVRTYDGAVNFADSLPGRNGYATAGGSSQAGFLPWEGRGETGTTLDTLTLNPLPGNIGLVTERTMDGQGAWGQQSSLVTSGAPTRLPRVDVPDNL